MAGNLYWEEIEHYFSKKRGKALILSPKDWPLVMSWQERGIPLKLIYEGIDNTFARLEERQSPSQQRTIRSLTSCQYDIEKLWKAQKSLEAGGALPATDDPRKRLVAGRQKLVTKLKSVVGQLQQIASDPLYERLQNDLMTSIQSLESCLPEIEYIENDESLVLMKQKMRGIERQLIAGLEQTVAADTRQRLLEQAEQQLASYKQNMQENVYQETLRIAFLQLLRDTYPVPSFL